MARREEFWAIYFQIGHLLAEEENALRHLGPDPDRLHAWYMAELTSETEWPVL